MPMTLAAAVSALLFFTAADTDHGRELWASDGTSAGTRLAIDLSPGADSTQFLSPLFPVKGGVIFIARPVGSGVDNLYFSDGAPAGTKMLVSGVHDYMGRAGNNFYFSRPAEEGYFLYWVRGDTAKVSRFKAIFQLGAMRLIPFRGNTLIVAPPRQNYNGHNYITFIHDVEANTLKITDMKIDANHKIPRIAALDDKLIYVTLTPKFGEELWISDGTKAGSALLKDIAVGTTGAFDADSGSFAFNGPVTIANRSYFQANDRIRGAELWMTDGTRSGTKLAADLVKGPDDADNLFFAQRYNNLTFNEPFAVGDYLLFNNGGGVFETFFHTVDDRTGEVKKVNLVDQAGKRIALVDTIENIGGTPGAAYFLGKPARLSDRFGLYAADLATGATRLVKPTDSSFMYCGEPWRFTSYGGRVYFSAGYGVENTFDCHAQLWTSDGTQEGTVMVKDILAGSLGSQPRDITVGGAP